MNTHDIHATDQDGTLARDASSTDTAESINDFEKQLSALRVEVAKLAESRAALAVAVSEEHAIISNLEQDLAPILERERAVMDTLHEVSLRERAASDPQERRLSEQSRWEHIGEWYAVEQEKWEKQETLDAQQKRTDAHREEHAQLTEKEQDVRLQIEQVELEKEKAELHTQLDEIVGSRVSTETQIDALDGKRKNALAQLQTVSKAEEDIERKEIEVEDLISSAHSLTEERTLVEERYALEKERHETESSRWNIEDEIALVGTTFAKSESELKELQLKESALLEKISSLEKQRPVLTPLEKIDTGELGVVPEELEFVSAPADDAAARAAASLPVEQIIPRAATPSEHAPEKSEEAAS